MDEKELTLADINKILGPQTTQQKIASWPSADEKEAIYEHIEAGLDYVWLYERKFTVTQCRHDPRCYYVKPVEGFFPCGHFST